MVLTRAVIPLVRPGGKVRSLVRCQNTGQLAWSEGSSRVCLGEWDGEALRAVASVDHSKPITCLYFHRGLLVVGDDLDGATVYDEEGALNTVIDVEGGVQDCGSLGSRALFLSGMGDVHLVDLDSGDSTNLSSKHGCHDVLFHCQVNDAVLLATQDGRVMLLNEHEVQWRRPSRGTIGERITGLGVTSKGSFFLTREGHALVAGDEEAIEFELWSNGQLIKRIDQRMRLLTSCPAKQGAVLGFDDGSVYLLAETGELSLVMETRHPIFSCAEVGGGQIATSWFYVHGTQNGVQWKVEHQGMATQLVVDEERGWIVFAGDDQNDYTEPEPIGGVRTDGDLVETDEAELSLWFSTPEAAPERSDEHLYTEEDNVLAHLSEDEQVAYNTVSTTGMDAALLEAMGEVTPNQAPDMDDLDDSALYEELNRVDHLSIEDANDLMEALSANVDSLVKPQAFAGEAQEHLADADGTCIVLLDGTGTEDPHQHVASWSWYNERGEEVANSAQVKVRLPIGTHVFELRVIDRDGSWTSDRIEIRVVDGSTS